MTTMTRSLGRSRIQVSALGFGCWAIGGPLWERGKPVGGGAGGDAGSRRAISAYGRSTDSPDGAAAFAMASHAVTAVQHDFSVLSDAAEVLHVCERFDLASVNRGPLAMGLLTGKYSAASSLGDDDVRGISPDWMEYFQDGRPDPAFLERVEAVREVLRSGGRTLAQGAIGCLWGRGDKTIPIPGCRTVARVEENAGALAYGPLTGDQVAEVDKLLGRL